MVCIRKGICMLFIVTEILCYIFAILFPPPNKSFPQITNPFPYRPLSKLGLSTYFSLPNVSGSSCTQHRPFWPGSLAGQGSWPCAASPSQPRRVCGVHSPCPESLGWGKGGARAGALELARWANVDSHVYRQVVVQAKASVPNGSLEGPSGTWGRSGWRNWRSDERGYWS